MVARGADNRKQVLTDNDKHKRWLNKRHHAYLCTETTFVSNRRNSAYQIHRAVCQLQYMLPCVGHTSAAVCDELLADDDFPAADT